jgi:hypothetical protein
MGEISKVSQASQEGQAENQDQEEGRSFAVLEDFLYDIQVLIQAKVDERVNIALLEYGSEFGREMSALAKERDHWQSVAIALG